MKEQVSSEVKSASSPPEKRRVSGVRKSVQITDKIADIVITVGGLSVILAVVGIMLFLVVVALPLFTGASITGTSTYSVPLSEKSFLDLMVDDYNSAAAMLMADGSLTLVHAPTGTPLKKIDLPLGGKGIAAFARTLQGGNIALGFRDGTVRFGRIAPRSRVLPESRLPRNLEKLNERDFSDGASVYSKIPGEQVRRVWIESEIGEPLQVAPEGTAIRKLDYKVGGTPERPSRSFATVDEKGVVRLSLTQTRVNLLTGETASTVESVVLPDLPENVNIVGILLTEKADVVYIGTEEGILYRFDTRNFEMPSLVETKDILPGGVRLTMFKFLIGEESIMAGGSDGSVRIYFRTRQPDAPTKDGLVLVRAHALEPHGAAVSGFSASQRSRMFGTADASGNVWLRHSTSEQVQFRLKVPEGGGAIRAIRLSPRDNGIYSVQESGKVSFWAFSAEHPETTVGTLFGKVWYEGYPASSYTWQSSSGDDAFEEKISLIPLIFGTIKGTVYSLIFAVPIAVFGAIFTSEFIHPRVRAIIKPVMEMMASLPSVVLGFIAALILAPFVETWIAAVLLAFMLIPFLLLLAAYLWQLMPPWVSLPLSGYPKILLMFGVLLAGAILGYLMGPGFEFLFFGGDFKAWVNGDIGLATPALFFIFLPLSFGVVSYTFNRLFGHAWKQMLRKTPHVRAAAFDLVRWGGMVVVTFLLNWTIASLLTALGFDARGGVIDTYVQRNSLVVGFAMGFAVIPIIYTIAEDALHSVPEHLRAASLGCGATPWQTALWVILPTAASGIFAAVMVGMGRAVGETMIVVMAAGNTPVLDWNIFSGLRALSANIAVELPEAVKDGTLYRVLFLAALVLFGMTFVVNTVAEVVRLRFRKRAAQL